MKQHLTFKQLEELSKEQKRKIEDLCLNYPLTSELQLTIGKMIEMLEDWQKVHGEYNEIEITKGQCNDENEWYVNLVQMSFQSLELCDALFEALKHVLEVGR